jgi:hypothetical protein
MVAGNRKAVKELSARRNDGRHAVANWDKRRTTWPGRRRSTRARRQRHGRRRATATARVAPRHLATYLVLLRPPHLIFDLADPLCRCHDDVGGRVRVSGGNRRPGGRFLVSLGVVESTRGGKRRRVGGRQWDRPLTTRARDSPEGGLASVAASEGFAGCVEDGRSGGGAVSRRPFARASRGRAWEARRGSQALDLRGCDLGRLCFLLNFYVGRLFPSRPFLSLARLF